MDRTRDVPGQVTRGASDPHRSVRPRDSLPLGAIMTLGGRIPGEGDIGSARG
jgi:hypothetical protein